MVASKPSSTTRKEMKVPKNPFWIEIRSKGTLGLRDHCLWSYRQALLEDDGRLLGHFLHQALSRALWPYSTHFQMPHSSC
jgi:hypothetical protein